MSYILDALRKAESERERDASAIGASLSGAALPTATATSLWQRLLPGLAVGLGLGLTALLAWYGLNPTATPVASSAPPQLSPPTPSAIPLPEAPPTAPAPPPADTSVVQVPTPAPPLRARTTRALPRDERPPASERVPEMPDDVRRSLPALNFGGAMYSDKPSSRMLVINGRVFHEGDTIAPDLMLETIQLKSAVLRVGGQRYSITY